MVKTLRVHLRRTLLRVHGPCTQGRASQADKWATGVHLLVTQGAGELAGEQSRRRRGRMRSAWPPLDSGRPYKANGKVCAGNRSLERAGGDGPRWMAAGRGGEGHSGPDSGGARARKLRGRSGEVVRASVWSEDGCGELSTVECQWRRRSYVSRRLQGSAR